MRLRQPRSLGRNGSGGFIFSVGGIKSAGGGLVASYGDRQTSDRSLACHAKWILDELGIAAPREFDCINVQLDRNLHVKPLRARLVDLGHREYRTTIDLHLLSLVSDRPLGWGGTLLKTSMDWLRTPGAFALDSGVLGLRRVSDEIATWRELNRKMPWPA